MRGLKRNAAKRQDITLAKRTAGILAGLALFGWASGTVFPATPSSTQARGWPAKDEITIAVMDSGLGGLSIMAAAAARLESAGLAERVNFVFFNALFDNESGYNSLPTREAKVRIFASALRSLASDFRPDIILVGCNTLSVLLPDVPFARTAGIAIIGIVDPGVDMIGSALKADPGARLILFGTETTIAEGTHRKKLEEMGIDGGRIVSQACPELAAAIENGFKSENTALLIEAYVDEAMAKIGAPPRHLVAGLICTHYGYALDLWTAAFAGKGVSRLTLLDPNDRLAEDLVPPGSGRRFVRTEIKARVVSMVEISARKRISLAEGLASRSPEVAAALRDYELRPDLFEWRALASR